MKKISLLVIIEFIVIIILVRVVFYQSKNVLGDVSISKIDKKNIVLNKKSDLKYFYESAPNNQVMENLSYLGLNYSITYKLNNDGFNQLQSYDIDKDDDVFRIITLGDSFTFGDNLNTEENYPSQLERVLNDTLSCKKIKKFEVLNLGMSGYDIQYSVERFKLKGLKYKPDLVLWFVIKDDLLRLNELFYPKMAKLPESVFNNKNQNLKANEEYYSSLKNIREEVINEIGGEDAVLAIQKQNLRDISRYYNGNLLIFTFHSVPDKYKTFLESFVSSRPKTFFFQQITKTNNKDYFLPDGHPSSKGAKMIAEDLFNYLYENKILKCN